MKGAPPRSLSLRVSAFLLLATLPLVSAVVAVGYLTTRAALTDQSDAIRNQLEQTLARTLTIVDRGTALAESVLEQFERPAQQAFLKAYQASPSVDDLDLEAVRRELRSLLPDRLVDDLDLYVIDREGIVVSTTYAPDLGLDFGRLPRFYRSLDDLFQEGGFRTDPLRPEIATGTVRRFSYQRTLDRRYILEIGLRLSLLEGQLAALGQAGADLTAGAWQFIRSVRIYATDGVAIESQPFAPLADSPSLSADGASVEPRFLPAVEEAATTGETVRVFDDDESVHSFIPVVLPRGASLEPTDRVIHAVFDLSRSRRITGRITTTILAGAAAILAVTLVGGFLLVRWVTRPIRDLVTEVALIGTGASDQRVSIEVARELAVLRDGVNRMVDRLVENQSVLERTVKERNQSLRRADALARIGRIAAVVAHDLATPLSVALTGLRMQQAEIAEQRTSNPAVAGEPELQEYLDAWSEAARVGLLSLTRADALVRSFKRMTASQISERRIDFDVADVAQDVVTSLDVIARRKGIELSCNRQSEHNVIHGSDGEMAQVVSNLVENSIQHAFPQEAREKRVSVTTYSDERNVTIVVSDNGRGIPREIRPLVLEPFFTTRTDAGGTGLGLSIVHDIVTESFGGSLTFSCDHGTEFTVTVPRHPKEGDGRS